MNARHLLGRRNGLSSCRMATRAGRENRQSLLVARGYASSSTQSHLQNNDESLSQSTTNYKNSLPLSNARITALLQQSSQLFTPDSILSSPVWLARTQKAAEINLHTNPSINGSQPDRSRLRIGIIGNRASGTESLIKVLLDDPLAQSATQTNQGANSVAEERQDNETQKSENAIRRLYYDTKGDTTSNLSSSTWLRERNVEFVELVNPTDIQTNRSMLYECDVLVFVLDEVTLAAHERFGRDLKVDDSLRLLRYFAKKPNTKVIVNHSGQHISNAQTLERGLQAAITEEAFASLGKDALQSSAIVHASLPLAQRANESLRQALARSAPGSPDASEWDHFTTLFSSSGFAEVRSLMEEQSKTRSEEGQALTADFALRRALEQAQFSIREYSEQAQQARGAANVIRNETDAALESIMKRIFEDGNKGAFTGRDAAMHKRAGDRSTNVDAAARDAWNEVEKALSTRLPWWKVVWKVDDVRAEMEAAIERGYARDLEQRLMVQTGRLISIAERLQRRIRTLFSSLNQSERKLNSTEENFIDTTAQEGQHRNPFASPLLLNELRKYRIEAIEARLQEEDLFTKPIILRRSQLLADGGPVDKLCTKAQSSTMKTVGLTGTTGLVTLASGLAGSSTLGAGMPLTFQLIALQPSTAFASFAFVSTIGAVFMQSRWSRAKRRFWREWQSISDGLDNDLQSNVAKVFDEIVAAQSRTAADGLERIANEYQDQLDQTQTKVQNLLKQSSDIPTSQENK
ncbi:uncharacterized protein FA14DRAFT_170834 [Meira miltonrushii]|uniref:Mmc1 C-terminal domain-containing protein n=1 Tax=Meira miltonrushii TaxID=1280837 RepID=A0A316VKV5_9BASI|nr:uncharacterized protein FA14DRAFT_170834 [Meira miltonrushii]PWN38100.1 hypothetical protein FA14DRAFT_170834 [Meira miltonrushii]